MTAMRPLTSSPQFLQGVFSFQGRGLQEPFLLDPGLVYTVPADREAQLVYFRAGNASAHLIYVVMMRDGEPMRYFPIGAESDTHIALRVVEDLLANTRLEVHVAAREGAGQVILDVGLVEI